MPRRKETSMHNCTKLHFKISLHMKSKGMHKVCKGSVMSVHKVYNYMEQYLEIKPLWGAEFLSMLMLLLTVYGL